MQTNNWRSALYLDRLRKTDCVTVTLHLLWHLLNVPLLQTIFRSLNLPYFNLLGSHYLISHVHNKFNITWCKFIMSYTVYTLSMFRLSFDNYCIWCFYANVIYAAASFVCYLFFYCLTKTPYDQKFAFNVLCWNVW